MASVGRRGAGSDERVFDGRVESPSDGVKRRRGAYDRAVAMPTVQGARGPDASTGCPSSTSARCSAASPPRPPTAGRRVVDLGRGNPEVGPPAHVVEALTEAAARPGRPRLRAVPRAARAARGDRAPLPRPLRRRDRSGHARSRSSRGRRRRSSSSRSRSPRRGDPILLPDPYYPDYPSGIALAGRGDRARPARPGRRLAARPRERPARRGSLPQLPLEPVRRLRRRPALFEAAVDYAGAHRHRDRPRRGVQRPRLRRPQARELPRDTRGEGRRRRALDDVQDLRDGRLADRVRARQRRHRRAAQPARRPLRASGSSRRSSTPRSRRSTARRTASRSAARPTSAAATGSSAALPEPPVSEGTFYVWLRLPERADARSGCSTSTGSRSRPARASARAAPAGRACRSPSPTRRSRRGIERLAPALEAAYA